MVFQKITFKFTEKFEKVFITSMRKTKRTNDSVISNP